jgi:hypothetical protein
MAVRNDLIANVTTQVADTGFSISSELPWVSGGENLYVKNMKTIYFGEEQTEIVQLYQTLDAQDVFQTDRTISAYVCVDAKTLPNNTSNVIQAMLDARGNIANVTTSECEVSTDIQVDKQIYTLEYRFTEI